MRQPRNVPVRQIRRAHRDMLLVASEGQSMPGHSPRASPVLFKDDKTIVSELLTSRRSLWNSPKSILISEAAGICALQAMYFSVER